MLQATKVLQIQSHKEYCIRELKRGLQLLDAPRTRTLEVGSCDAQQVAQIFVNLAETSSPQAAASWARSVDKYHVLLSGVQWILSTLALLTTHDEVFPSDGCRQNPRRRKEKDSFLVDLSNISNEDCQKLLRLIFACWDPISGGFRSAPGEPDTALAGMWGLQSLALLLGDQARRCRAEKTKTTQSLSHVLAQTMQWIGLSVDFLEEVLTRFISYVRQLQNPETGLFCVTCQPYMQDEDLRMSLSSVVALRTAHTLLNAIERDCWEPSSQCACGADCIVCDSCITLLRRTINVDKLINAVLSAQNSDGGFGCWHKQESHSGYCFSAVSLLTFCGSLDRLCLESFISSSVTLKTGAKTRLHALCGYLKNRVSSGKISGRPGKSPDVCYAWWILATIIILHRYFPKDTIEGTITSADVGHVLEWLISCQHDRGGISRSPPIIHFDSELPLFANLSDEPETEVPDVYHTYFALATISLLQEEYSDTGHGITPLNHVDPCTALPFVYCIWSRK